MTYLEDVRTDGEGHLDDKTGLLLKLIKCEETLRQVLMCLRELVHCLLIHNVTHSTTPSNLCGVVKIKAAYSDSIKKSKNRVWGFDHLSVDHNASLANFQRCSLSILGAPRPVIFDVKR